MWFKPGDFGFVKDEKMRKILENDYLVIENHLLWNWFKTKDHAVDWQFETLVYKYKWCDVHNGETFRYSMGEMEKIAKNGWDFYDMFY